MPFQQKRREEVDEGESSPFSIDEGFWEGGIPGQTQEVGGP